MLTFLALGYIAVSSHAKLPVQSTGFWVRPGFRVDVVAENLGQARFMELDDKGNLYLARSSRGDIITLRKSGQKYNVQSTYIQGYPLVHGMHFWKGWLWFTTSNSIYRSRDTNGDGIADEVVPVLRNLVNGGGHWFRTICVVGDGFYTGIGDSGNATDETNSDRQKIWKYSLDGSKRTLFASGVRNTEKLQVRPGTSELYGADNGSDAFGDSLGERSGEYQPITDNNPPCEFNLYSAGGFYGHPFLVGNRIPRYEYANSQNILSYAAQTIPPAWSLGAHWAPLGWTFLKSVGLGAEYRGDAIIACHGSWNSTKPVGYRLERVMFDPVLGKACGSQLLVSTLSATGSSQGRPVDVVEEANGTILFSDDQNNRIYRLSRIR